MTARAKLVKWNEIGDTLSCVKSKIIVSHESSLLSTITENGDRSNYTSITKDYFVTGDQHLNTIAKNRYGDIWIELRKAVVKAIDQDLKGMMIRRSQEVGLKVITDDDEKPVSSWNDIGKAWRNSDSIDTAKNYTRSCMQHLMTTLCTKYTWEQK